MLTYLSAVEFGEKFGMAKDVFYKLPKWKQNKLKMALDFDFEQSRAVDFERKLIVGETSTVLFKTQYRECMCCHAFVVGLLNFHGKCLARQYVLFCFWVARDSSSKPKRFAVFQVYLNRAHLTSWKNDHGEELLFVSSKAIFKPPKAIHGGIPICSPQGVYLNGAHMTSWKNDHGEDLLLLAAVLSFIVLLENKLLIAKKSLESVTGFGSSWYCSELYCLEQYSNLQRQLVEAFQYALKLFFFLFQLASSLLKNLSCNLQFGSHDSLEQHGFARNRFWSIDTDPRPFPINSKSFIDLILKPFEEDMQKWRRR
ncbi:hypothetical protein SADUNF_Sadunf15G0038700 [Salix dunnii]|uniref:HP domain-containing protein n=1 Tax=Salix dunnii TaxID=1413687 RepID=A0A835JI49_9ROSI|nr:hypothetical protein SADUNF_Sadunf15G0038700 [Salix dunnii]